MSSFKNVSRDTLIYGAGAVIQRFVGFILLPFYTRALTPADYGVLDILTTLVFFIGTIFGLGLSGATSRYFFIAESEDEKKRLLYTSSTIRLISFSIPFLFFILFSSKISILLFATDKYSLVIMFTGFLFYFTTQQDIQSQIFRFYREAVKYNVVTLLKTVIYPLSGILLVVILGWGVLGATLANLIAAITALTFGYFYFARKKYIRQFSRHWAKKMLRYGFPLIFTSMLTWVNSVSDRFFLLHFKDLTQIGLYSIGNTFSTPIQLINMAISMGSMVVVMSLYSEEKEENKPKTKALLTKIWHTYLAIAISVAVFISIFSYNIVNFITTPSYIGGILAMPFLLFAQILYYSTDLTGNGMTFKEQSKPYALIMFIAAGSNFGLNFYFIPKFGYIGAAITTITSNIIYFSIAYHWSQKVFYIKRNFFKPALYFLIGLMIAVFFPFYELKYGSPISYFIKTGVLFLVLTLPFIFNFLEYRQLRDLIFMVRQKLR